MCGIATARSALVLYSQRIGRGRAVVCALVGVRLACLSARCRSEDTDLNKAKLVWGLLVGFALHLFRNMMNSKERLSTGKATYYVVAALLLVFFCTRKY